MKTKSSKEALLASAKEFPSIFYKDETAFPLLSLYRQTLLTVVDFKKTDSVLEVGSACGVLSNYIAPRVQDLTCLEENPTFNQVNLLINKDFANIEVLPSSLHSFRSKKRFDKIFLIGVFDEMGDDTTTQQETMRLAEKLLKKSGKIYIAVDNKFSMRSFAGVPVGEQNKAFTGLENNHFGMAKGQLVSLLKDSGFAIEMFYYPFPDYMYPSSIYSDAYLPKVGQLRNLKSAYHKERVVTFDEEKAFDNAIASGEFSTFANSYFVVASKEKEQ